MVHSWLSSFRRCIEEGRPWALYRTAVYVQYPVTEVSQVLTHPSIAKFALSASDVMKIGGLPRPASDLETRRLRSPSLQVVFLTA